MASESVQSRLQTLTDASTLSSSKSAEYKALLDHILSTPSSEQLPHDLAAFVTSVLTESLGIVAARPLLTDCVEALRQLPSIQTRIEVGKHMLAALEPRVASFEDQDATVREILADAYQDAEDYAEAARVLEKIKLDSSHRKTTDRDKVGTWIRICRLYLEEDDATSAELYLNRAKQLLYRVDSDPDLRLKFQLSQARIFDSRRRFPEASAAFHEVSLAAQLAEDDRIHALTEAIVCAVLTPAGPQRARLLGTLYKDERATSLGEFGILEKVFLDHLISPEEADAFAKKLAAHQLARTADGSTVLSAAISEHNLRAASKLYRNLGTKELGSLLGLDAEKAESYAARMLEQGRLAGRIDQIDGVVFFDDPEVSGAGAGAGTGSIVTGEEHGILRLWDRNVQALVEDVERVSSLLQAEIPVSPRSSWVNMISDLDLFSLFLWRMLLPRRTLICSRRAYSLFWCPHQKEQSAT